MSIFSKIKGAKKVAEQHQGAKGNDGEADEPPQYHHVPTHAAIDALSGAAESWKAADRVSIKVQNKRRSDMMSRTNSNLSVMSTGKRNSSNSGSEWGSTPVPTKRPELRGYQHSSGSWIGHSRTPSGNDITPVASWGNSSTSSTSSQELELPVKRKAKPMPPPNIFTHIHTSTHRKVGEAPLYDVAPIRPLADGTIGDVNGVRTIPTGPVYQKKRNWGLKKSSAIAAY